MVLNDTELDKLKNGAKFNIFENLNGSWPNRSLNPTVPRAGFFVRREYSKGSMLSLKQVLGDYTKNVTLTSVQNGQRRLAPNRYAAPTFYRAGMGTVVEEN